MNSSEGIDMAKMAVMILLVVLVIGAVVGLAYMAYGWVTSGSDKLGDTVNSLDSSSYAQYDDAQCSGTDVLTALKSYRDSDIAILIANGGTDGTYTCGKYAATPANVMAMNYCGAVKKDASADSATITAPVTVNYSLTGTDGIENAFWVYGMVWGDNGLTVRNTNFSPTTNKSTPLCYVRQNAQFYSNLVYDKTTGEVCGILFRQMN